jgi:heme exporter protein A
VSCERDERLLFSRLNLACYAGEVVQITGPNGSGKTTLLRALAGVSPDYSGSILWCGQVLTQAKWEYTQDLAYIGHLPGIKKALTPIENLQWYTAIAGGAEQDLILEALVQVGLYGYHETPCHQLSAGQLRRVALARLYLTQASIWILDEPFTAIDKAGIRQLEQLLESHTSKGGLVILTSHQDLSLARLKLVDLLDFQFPQEAEIYAS